MHGICLSALNFYAIFTFEQQAVDFEKQDLIINSLFVLRWHTIRDRKTLSNHLPQLEQRRED
jgi:hypothetical protein